MKSLSLLIKPASGACNLRCKYCFYHDLSSMRKEKSYGMMQSETIEAIVRKTYDYVDGTATFGFQGGEPMLRGLDFFKSFVSLVKKYNKNNIKTFLTLQTNGILIDEPWAEFFADNSFLIGLSLDGYKDIHDINRIDDRGEGTFNKVLNASKILNKYNVEYNILCVVTKSLARHGAKVYNYLKSKGFKYLQFIPCLDSIEQKHGGSVYSLASVGYGKFLNTVMDLWYDDFVKGNYISIRMFDNLVLMLKGYPPESCDMQGSCTAGSVIEADGGVYPCDFYVMDEWRLGNILHEGFEQMQKKPLAEKFVISSKNIPLECKTCDYYFLCRGGCRRHKEPAIEEQPLKNNFCEAYKLFYSQSLEKLKHVARNI